MPYRMYIRSNPEHTFRIKQEHKEEALAALLRWEPHQTHTQSLEDYLHFHTEWGIAKNDLKTNDITGVWLYDDANDDEQAAQLFTVLAPFVEPGSRIEMEDNKGNYWQWVFFTDGVYYIGGRIAFDEPLILLKPPDTKEG